MKTKKTKKKTYYALVMLGGRSVAYDADNRLDVYVTKEAALSSDNRAIGDRLVKVNIEIVEDLGKAK